MFPEGTEHLAISCLIFSASPWVQPLRVVQASVPTPTRHQMATWIRDSWEQLTDEALKSATIAAYFPDGLKFSQLLDTAYFGDEAGHSSSDSDSAGSGDDKDGGDEDDGSTSDGSSCEGSTSDGSMSDGHKSVHSSGSDRVQSFSEGEVINSEGEVVEEGDCPTTDEYSEMDSDSEVVWATSARGTWGFRPHLWGQVVFYPEKWIPKKLEAPTVAKPAPKPAPKRGKQPVAKPATASSSIPVADGQHVPLFKTMWDRKKKFYTVPVQQ